MHAPERHIPYIPGTVLNCNLPKGLIPHAGLVYMDSEQSGGNRAGSDWSSVMAHLATPAGSSYRHDGWRLGRSSRSGPAGNHILNASERLYSSAGNEDDISSQSASGKILTRRVCQVDKKGRYPFLHYCNHCGYPGDTRLWISSHDSIRARTRVSGVGSYQDMGIWCQ